MNWSQIVVFSAALMLSACNQNVAPPANPLAGDANVNSWAIVQNADLNVPRGVSYQATNVGGAIVADISHVPDVATTSGKTGGVSVRMSSELETQASGGLIRVVVRAYTLQPGSSFGVAYSTNEVGNSGWLQFPLTATPSDYVFSYFVPTMQRGNGDFLGFRSYGSGTVRIVGFKVEVTPATPTAHAAAPALRTTTPPPAAGTSQQP